MYILNSCDGDNRNICRQLAATTRASSSVFDSNEAVDGRKDCWWVRKQSTRRWARTRAGSARDGLVRREGGGLERAAPRRASAAQGAASAAQVKSNRVAPLLYSGLPNFIQSAS
eukprot:6181762-Pleurochrysis_carterae.AAC.5